MFNALYKAPPGGFRDAISIGEPLLKTNQSTNAQLQLWMACAYAQRATYTKKTNQSAEAFEADRQKALACLVAMVRLSPDMLPLARELWRPDEYDGDPSENDFEVFRDDPDFIGVLTGSRLPAHFTGGIKMTAAEIEGAVQDIVTKWIANLKQINPTDVDPNATFSGGSNTLGLTDGGYQSMCNDCTASINARCSSSIYAS